MQYGVAGPYLSGMSTLAFYGDSEGSEVLVIDVDAMCLKGRVPTGLGPYPVDRAGTNFVLASTRKENSVTPIEISSLSALPAISLPHTPRSSTIHPETGLILVSGGNKPITSIIDSRSWTVLRSYGEAVTGKVEDFGGSLACGHERWVDAERFFLIDRLRRRLVLYRFGVDDPIWTLNTPTSCHHLVADPQPDPPILYAMCEGNPLAKVPPSILKLTPAGDGFTVEAHVFLPVETSLIGSSGGHHVDLSGDYLYAGSAEGHAYVFRKDTLTFVAKIVTGAGDGHTGFIDAAGRSFGITINHTARFVTVFDRATHQRIKDIVVSNSDATPQRRTQGHTSWKRDGFFYIMASLDATFHEIDVVSGEVKRCLVLEPAQTGGAKPFPMQGTFATDVPGAFCTHCC